MFSINGSRSVYNRAEIEKIIIEGTNITIAFREGYEENGTFVGVGSDHIMLSGTDAGDFVFGLSKEKNKDKVIKKAMDDAEAVVAKVRTPKVKEPEVIEPIE